jgi:hypothetical protein
MEQHLARAEAQRAQRNYNEKIFAASRLRVILLKLPLRGNAGVREGLDAAILPRHAAWETKGRKSVCA